MLLRSVTLKNMTGSFQTRMSELSKINPDADLSLYVNAVEQFSILLNNFTGLCNEINQLIEFNKNLMTRQDIILKFVLQNKDKLEAYIKKNHLHINLNELIDIMKIFSRSKLVIDPFAKDDFTIDELIDRLKIIKQWMPDKENLIFFTSIDELNSIYIKYYNFFKQFFASSPDIANQKTIKLALDTKENANDAVQFEKIFQEPTAMLGRYVVYFDTMEKHYKRLQVNIDLLIDNNYQKTFKSRFNDLKLAPGFLQEAKEAVKKFATELTSTKNKTKRFNQREEEEKGLGDKKAKIRFDLCQSNIIDPSSERKLNYKICCEYYQVKLDRLIIYLNDYTFRCKSSTLPNFLLKHNANGTVFSEKIKKIWSEKYGNAYTQLQITLANSQDFIGPFLKELNAMRMEAIELLKQYNVQGGFDVYSGKNYMMAYIKEMTDAIAHITVHKELPMHPDIVEQLKKIGSSDDERKLYHDQLTTQSSNAPNPLG